MKTILLSCLLILSAQFLLGQSIENESAVRQHQISIDAIDLLRNQNVEVLYRRKTEKGNLRFGLNAGFNSNLLGEGPNGTTVGAYTGRLGLRFGHEWHRTWREFTWYYGADMNISSAYSYNENENTSTQVDLVQITQREQQSLQGLAAVQPLLGIQYQINPMISIGGELRSSFAFGVVGRQSTTTETLIDPITNTSETSFISSPWTPSGTFSFQTIANQSIWISLHF
ncbi:MAG: hypothetical protein AAFQ87_05170 [Bacteroidota bacterium]